MPTVSVTRRTFFNAAHRLHNPSKSDAWNKKVYGRCNSPNWHGHNYVLEVTIRGEPDPDTGFIMDLDDLHTVITERIINKVDHLNLNLDVDFLRGVIPSTENLVIAFWRELELALPTGLLCKVRLHERERNIAEYTGD